MRKTKKKNYEEGISRSGLVFRPAHWSPAGAELLFEKPKKKHDWCMGFLKDFPGRVLQLEYDSYLPLKEYLKRRPLEEFFMLISRGSLVEGQCLFLSDPFKHEYGSVPFRFESEGETRYYCNQNGFVLEEHLLAHSGRFTIL